MQRYVEMVLLVTQEGEHRDDSRKTTFTSFSTHNFNQQIETMFAYNEKLRLIKLSNII